MLRSGQASIRTFRVTPNVPGPLEPLLEIANNLWWTWQPEAVNLFRRLDRDLWEKTGRNPVKLLGQVSQESLERAANDRSYLHALSIAHARLLEHRERTSWFQRSFPDGERSADGREMRVAYFSAEFGFTECLQIYSGGLGVLAGDHVKAASELGIPMCAVGLLYRCGYFHQYLNEDGWQQETYPDLDLPNQPIRRLIDPETGEQYRVTLEFPGRDVVVGIWQAQVGRVPVYLLDTNMPENSRADRDITYGLYGGDVERRIQQEIVLGVGGVRALELVGETPTVFHINEGHAAFLGLERIAMFRSTGGATFEEARAAASVGHLFTTHTPVPAGIDRFDPKLIDTYITDWMCPRLGIDRDELMGLARANPFDNHEFFSMAILAIRTSGHCNGVSRLHGQVSREMWQEVWPNVPEDEVPIGHVTNGVHPRSWIAPALMRLYDRYLGPDWQLDPLDFATWDSVNHIPDEELWRHHVRQREKLITWCRRKIRRQLAARGAARDEIEAAAGALDPTALTIGFARRFATYKRATLLLDDIERVRRLFNDADRPIQLLVAGKAHPADGPGKDLIRSIVKFANESDHLNRIVFLEDYDMDLARRMVQGVDIWLNTPRRGMEASGTSGMKAALNGVINVSILDGWWDEAYTPELGFAIGKGETYDSEEEADAVESRALYDLLERRIIPEFFDVDESGIPHKWVARMKACIRALTPAFSTNRMVADYTQQYYRDAHRGACALQADNLASARELAARMDHWRRHWGEVEIRDMTTDAPASVAVRSSVRVRARVALGQIPVEQVSVQCYEGRVTSMGDLVDGTPIEMSPAGPAPESPEETIFEGEFQTGSSGRRGVTVRVVPRDERLTGMIPGLITWFHAGPSHRHQEAPGKSSAEREQPAMSGA